VTGGSETCSKFLSSSFALLQLCSGYYRRSGLAFSASQQFRQLGDIHHDPSRLIVTPSRLALIQINATVLGRVTVFAET
jgi:hypothetical protein